MAEDYGLKVIGSEEKEKFSGGNCCRQQPDRNDNGSLWP